MSGRLIAWASLIGVLSALNYAARFAGGKPPRDALYHWSAAVEGLVQYGIILAIVLWIARADGELLALRRPVSWKLAVGLAGATLVGIFALNALLEPLLHAGHEQGLTPKGWDPSRTAPFAANFVVIALVAPVVEELTFRGLGFGLLERYGQTAVILLVGLAFALWHGLVGAFPILFAFGAALAYLRARTESVYPAMLLHGTFNALSLAAAVTIAT